MSVDGIGVETDSATDMANLWIGSIALSVELPLELDPGERCYGPLDAFLEVRGDHRLAGRGASARYRERRSGWRCAVDSGPAAMSGLGGYKPREPDKLQVAGEHLYQIEAVSDGPLGGYLMDRKLGKPARPCSRCGHEFEPTTKRRMLCGPCFSKAWFPADSARCWLALAAYPTPAYWRDPCGRLWRSVCDLRGFTPPVRVRRDVKRAERLGTALFLSATSGTQ